MTVSSKSGLSKVAKEVAEEMISRGVVFTGETKNLISGNIEQSSTHKYVRDATFVSIVLYKSGYLSEEDINKYNYNIVGNNGILSMLKAAGWERVGDEEIKEGDVIIDYARNDALIYAGDRKVWDYSCAAVTGTKIPTGEPYVGWDSKYKGKSNVQIWRRANKKDDKKSST